ncbi:MAG TPA: Maf family nucleotide pyrophosphatase [Bacteroidales bacterium]|nr:Maf family nucleotide pyrophosphatase [Bacteroidales bacterium]
MVIDNLNSYRIILASRSPRRQQLLKELGIKFDVLIREYPESYPENLVGKQIATYVAYEKALSFKGEISDNEIVITADTIVWCNHKVLGKPLDHDDAIRILKEISGNIHEVITGVCIFSSVKERTFSVSTKVTFDTLSDEEIRYYVERFKPYDKAGAYGIQEWIGLAGCSYIEGSYSNVVGLPVQRLYRELQRFILE